MTAPARLVCFAATLAVLFGAAFEIGRLTGSSGPEPSATVGPAPAPATGANTSAPPMGLLVSERGYRLRPATTRLHDHGDPVFTFAVTGPDGAVVTAFTPTGGVAMDLIVVSRDLAGYRHVQPARAPDGTWSVPLRLPTPGSYRAFARFQPAAAGRELTLGVDLVAGGWYQPQPLPSPARAVRAADVEVSVAGWLRPGRSSRLVFSLSRGGIPVADLQGYRGVRAQLIAIRDGDLAYLPVRAGAGGAGPDLAFEVAVPGPGTYRLFLDFIRGGTMQTAAFTLVAS